VVDADCVLLIVFVVTQAVDAFVFLRICCAFLKLVTSCAEGAGFLSSAVASSVVESGAFVAPGSNHIVLYFADLPSEFYLLVQLPVVAEKGSLLMKEPFGLEYSYFGFCSIPYMYCV
jgi:hypothetical protein